MKTSELLNGWLENYEKEHIKPRTYRRYRGLIDLHISPNIGEIDTTELTRQQIQEFLSKKKKDGNIRTGEKLSATSINLMLTIMNSRDSVNLTILCAYNGKSPRKSDRRYGFLHISYAPDGYIGITSLFVAAQRAYF